MVLTCVSFKIAVQNFSVFSVLQIRPLLFFSFTEIAVGDCAIDDFPTLVVTGNSIPLQTFIFHPDIIYVAVDDCAFIPACQTP